MKIKGTPASGGIISGKIKKYVEGISYSAEEIMLASNTTPDMCLEILNSGAVITKHGGLLSHAAIFCREIKKPCIVGIKDALDNVEDDVTITVNADEGTIEILD